MSFIIGLLTFILVVNCLVLIVLVLMQLPKKDAGAGLAFGGGATDALFGAGSGNVLTNATKYAATLFFALALLIGILQSNFHNRSVNTLKATVDGQMGAVPASSGALPGTTPAAGSPAPATTPEAAPVTNLSLETTAPAEAQPEEPPAQQ
jgi:preprotein translocase subunit SecG